MEIARGEVHTCELDAHKVTVRECRALERCAFEIAAGELASFEFGDLYLAIFEPRINEFCILPTLKFPDDSQFAVIELATLESVICKIADIFAQFAFVARDGRGSAPGQ